MAGLANSLFNKGLHLYGFDDSDMYSDKGTNVCSLIKYIL
jgi:hypothetical protein